MGRFIVCRITINYPLVWRCTRALPSNPGGPEDLRLGSNPDRADADRGHLRHELSERALVDAEPLRLRGTDSTHGSGLGPPLPAIQALRLAVALMLAFRLSERIGNRREQPTHEHGVALSNSEGGGLLPSVARDEG